MDRRFEQELTEKPAEFAGCCPLREWPSEIQLAGEWGPLLVLMLAETGRHD